jgi:hypothetical protein
MQSHQNYQNGALSKQLTDDVGRGQSVSGDESITINVPDVYMERYLMVLRRAISITRGIRKGGPWKARLFWALK